MTGMDKNGEPTLEEILAGIEKIRNAEDKAVPRAPLRAMTDAPRRPQKPEPPAFALGGAPKPAQPAPQPAAESLDELVHRALTAAADATIQPWLYTHLPRIIEQRLGTLLNERVDQMAAAVQQQITDEVNQRLGAALKHSVATIEKGLAAASGRHIADALGQRLEPAVNKHVAAAEERLSNALDQRVADEIQQRLERAIGKHLAAIEERLAIALDARVTDAVLQQLEPTTTKHVAAAEERIASAASRQVKDEISRRLKRIADDG